MINGANNRKKIDIKKERLKTSILKNLQNTDSLLSTSDLSHSLDKAWHTIDRACLMLQIDGKIEGIKIGRMNLWRLK